MCQQHSLRVGVYDPNGPKVRGGTDGGAVKTATGMRAGFGVALSNGTRIGRPLPGKRQTAQRAEVAALAVALEATSGPLTLVVDNAYVCDTAKSLQDGASVDPRSKHGDYWCYIAQHIHKLEEIRWIKSHPTRDQAMSGSPTETGSGMKRQIGSPHKASIVTTKAPPARGSGFGSSSWPAPSKSIYTGCMTAPRRTI